MNVAIEQNSWKYTATNRLDKTYTCWRHKMSVRMPIDNKKDPFTKPTI
jgi:hypothetical protein